MAYRNTFRFKQFHCTKFIWKRKGSVICPRLNALNYWDRVTHICAGNLTTNSSDNGLSPGRRQTIIWRNVGILSIEPLGTNLSEIWIEIKTFSFKKIHLKLSSGNRPFCLGLNVLKAVTLDTSCMRISSPSPSVRKIWVTGCMCGEPREIKQTNISQRLIPLLSDADERALIMSDVPYWLVSDYPNNIHRKMLRRCFNLINISEQKFRQDPSKLSV